MWTKTMRIPASSRVTTPDVLLALWAAIWIVLAVAVVENTRDLAKLGKTVTQTGAAVKEVGGAINSIPLIPSEVSSASDSIQEAGTSAQVTGLEGGQAADHLGIYLGIAIAVLPSIPILGLYLPLRFRRINEARAARRSLAKFGQDATFQEFLARRALEHLSFEEVMAVSERPWEDLEQGRFHALANAELERLEIPQGLPVQRGEPRAARPEPV